MDNCSTNCFACKLHTSRTRVVCNCVVPDSQICFITVAPGAVDEQVGEPLNGQMGYIFDECLRSVGIDRSRCSVVQAVRCRPPGDREPSKDEIKACAAFMEEDIRRSGAKIIMPLGALAVQALFGKKTAITKMVGQVFYMADKYPGVNIVPAYNPWSVLRDPGNRSKITGPMGIAKSMLEGTYGASANTGEYIQLTTKEQAAEAFMELSAAPEFAFDIEYSSPDHKPMNGRILCCSFSMGPGKAWWIVWEDLIAWMPRCLAALLASDKLKIIHNSMCELKWLRWFGFPIAAPVFDTMVAEYLLDEGEKAYSTDILSLKKLAIKHTDMGDYAAEIEKLAEATKKNADSPADYGLIPMDKLGPYNGKDSDAAFRVYLRQKGMLAKLDKITQLFSMLMASSELLSRVELNGAYVDVTQLDAVKTELLVKIETHKQEMEEWLRGANPRSPIQLAKALQAKGVVLTEVTKKNKQDRRANPNIPPRYKLDEEVLSGLAEQYTWIKSLLNYKTVEKLRSTYTDSFRMLLDAHNYIRTNYSLCFTDTGRLASRGPNLQNIPKNSKIRDMFAAPPGYSIVQADASQAELRWGAVHTNDPTLIRLLNDDTVDIHTSVASEVFGVPVDQITKEQRSQIKPVNFGIFYGAMAQTIANEAGISVEEADALIKRWFERFHYVQEWKDRTVANARVTGYVESVFGRRRRLPGLLSHDDFVRQQAERQCINAPIQADASDMTLFASVLADKVIAESEFKPTGRSGTTEVMTVHDSLMYYVLENREQAFMNLVQPVLEGMLHMVVPFKFDFAWGRTWGSLVEQKKKKGVADGIAK